MIDKVQYRDYVVNDDGLMTTELGDQIAQALEEWAPRMTDSDFTAELQRSLDDVRTGDKDWEDVVEETREWVAEVCIEIKKSEEEIGQEIRQAFVREDACPRCDGTLYLRDQGFWGCENYHDEDCTFTADQGELDEALT
jgi:DNA topoisomerase-1